jgi:hypothetical protein
MLLADFLGYASDLLEYDAWLAMDGKALYCLPFSNAVEELDLLRTSPTGTSFRRSAASAEVELWRSILFALFVLFLETVRPSVLKHGDDKTAVVSAATGGLLSSCRWHLVLSEGELLLELLLLSLWGLLRTFWGLLSILCLLAFDCWADKDDGATS